MSAGSGRIGRDVTCELLNASMACTLLQGLKPALDQICIIEWIGVLLSTVKLVVWCHNH
jgi:hypothetical protein